MKKNQISIDQNLNLSINGVVSLDALENLAQTIRAQESLFTSGLASSVTMTLGEVDGQSNARSTVKRGRGRKKLSNYMKRKLRLEAESKAKAVGGQKVGRKKAKRGRPTKTKA